MRTHRLFLALAVFASVAAPGLLKVRAANVLDPASFACTDPEVLAGSVNQSLLSATAEPLAAFERTPEQKPVSLGSACALHGTGGLSYCAGDCNKAGLTCADSITSSGISCACKRVITQP